MYWKSAVPLFLGHPVYIHLYLYLYMIQTIMIIMKVNCNRKHKLNYNNGISYTARSISRTPISYSHLSVMPDFLLSIKVTRLCYSRDVCKSSVASPSQVTSHLLQVPIQVSSHLLQVQVKSQVFWPQGKSSKVPSQLAIAQVQVKSQVFCRKYMSSRKYFVASPSQVASHSGLVASQVASKKNSDSSRDSSQQLCVIVYIYFIRSYFVTCYVLSIFAVSPKNYHRHLGIDCKKNSFCNMKSYTEI